MKHKPHFHNYEVTRQVNLRSANVDHLKIFECGSQLNMSQINTMMATDIPPTEFTNFVNACTIRINIFKPHSQTELWFLRRLNTLMQPLIWPNFSVRINQCFHTSTAQPAMQFFFHCCDHVHVQGNHEMQRVYVNIQVLNVIFPPFLTKWLQRCPSLWRSMKSSFCSFCHCSWSANRCYWSPASFLSGDIRSYNAGGGCTRLMTFSISSLLVYNIMDMECGKTKQEKMEMQFSWTHSSAAFCKGKGKKKIAPWSAKFEFCALCIALRIVLRT